MPNKKIGLSLIAIFALCGVRSEAQDSETPQLDRNNYTYEVDGVPQEPSLFFDTGYRVDSKDVQTSYIYTNEARAIFGNESGLKSHMPAHMPAAFNGMIRDVRDYIAKVTEADPTIEKKNGITDDALAEKIVRASFCFGTDPMFVTSQIMTESTFKRKAVSGTGAVGFTQMTSIAIDEVNDQLGNRGLKGAPEDIAPVLMQSINCYESGNGQWTQMFAPGQAISNGQLINGSFGRSMAAKRWLGKSVDRDLIYGQIILKTYLARFRQTGLGGQALYTQAFKSYNGEPGRRKTIYARKIMRRVQQI